MKDIDKVIKGKSKEKILFEKLFYDYFFKIKKKEYINYHIQNDEDEIVVKNLSDLGLLEFEVIVDENEIIGIENKIIILKNNFIKIKMLDKSFEFMRNKKIKGKKCHNPHDQILYRCMNTLSKNKEIYCFSDFELDTHRPDIFCINKNLPFEQMNPVVYEIKHSRSDFFADISNPEKRKSYIKYSNYFYYVCEEDLIKAEEVPEGCGLIYISKKDELIVVKKSNFNNLNSLSKEDRLNLLLILMLRSFPLQRNIQIKISDEINFDFLEKHEVRNQENSLIFSDQHLLYLKEIANNKNNVFRPHLINSFTIGYLSELFYWGLLCRSEAGILSVSKKGSFILNKILEIDDKYKKEIPEYFEKNSFHIIKNYFYNGLIIPYLLIPLTKKQKNMKTTVYFYAKNIDEVNNLIKEYEVNLIGAFNYFYIILDAENIEINKKNYPKEIGFCTLKSRDSGIKYIEKVKNSKKQDVTIKEELILSNVLNGYINDERNKYVLFK